MVDELKKNQPRRRFEDDRGKLWLGEGDYGRIHGRWYVRPPKAHMTELSDVYAITEHGDGTISVSREIKARGMGDNPDYTGFLEFGKWRQTS